MVDSAGASKDDSASGDKSANPDNASLTVSAVADAVRALLELVDARTREVLELRFGLHNGATLTLQAVGSRMELTRERIRQIQSAGMRIVQAEGNRIPETVRVAREGIRAILKSLGGAVLERALLEAVGGRTPRDAAALELLLTSLRDVTEARETKRTYAHWRLAGGADAGAGSHELPALEAVHEAAERSLEQSGKLVPEAQLFAALRKELDVPAAVTDRAFRSLLAISKGIVRTPFDEWGLRGWSEATPRSAGDKAYIVLKRAGKPLHFTEIGGEINRLTFDQKQIHPQTVHNELIRSARFVLVGRGIYGLREWGHEAGTVADVLVRILARAERPLPRHELVETVLKERLVKRNTVLLALQNRRLFHQLEDGTYVLAPPLQDSSRGSSMPPTLGEGTPTPSAPNGAESPPGTSEGHGL